VSQNATPRRPDIAPPEEDPNAEAPGYASPPCMMHEMDPAYAGVLPRDELIALLNQLAEAERAGVRVTAAYGGDAADEAVRRALREVGLDEARFCAMLTRHVERLGGRPSHATGAFVEKALAVEGDGARLAFLNRGQGWVVRKLREALPRIADDALHADLAEMLAAHERNIGRCEALAGPTDRGGER
jgi:hypothetical protein